MNQQLFRKCGPARDIYLSRFYLFTVPGSVCRASAGACQCTLPMDANCHAPGDTWWQKQCHPITCTLDQLWQLAAELPHIPPLHQWLRDAEKKYPVLQDSSVNPSLGKFRWCYWWRLVRSLARACVVVLTAAFSVTTTGVVVLLSEPLCFHILKYKPIRTVFFSCVSLPNKQTELPRFIQSHL